MNPLQIGAAFGLLIAVGVWCMAQSVQRAPRSLASARHRMAGNGRSGTPHSVGRSSGLRANWAELAAAGAPGRWAAGHFGERLATIGMTPTDVVSRVLAASGVMAFILLAGLVALMAMGLVPVSVDSKPVVNHSLRCADEPWVNAPGSTLPLGKTAPPSHAFA